MKYYSAIRKNENLPLATTWIDLEGLNKINQRKTNTVLLLMYEIQKIKQMDKYNKTETDSQK